MCAIMYQNVQLIDRLCHDCALFSVLLCTYTDWTTIKVPFLLSFVRLSFVKRLSARICVTESDILLSLSVSQSVCLSACLSVCLSDLFSEDDPFQSPFLCTQT